MASITFSVDDGLWKTIKEFSWINWSEIARVDALKKAIFERYIKSGKEVTDEDWEFCESIDWHPVDELPFKQEYLDRLESARKEKPIKLKSISEIFE